MLPSRAVAAALTKKEGGGLKSAAVMPGPLLQSAGSRASGLCPAIIALGGGPFFFPFATLYPNKASSLIYLLPTPPFFSPWICIV